jgi:hypothetical protein
MNFYKKFWVILSTDKAKVLYFVVLLHKIAKNTNFQAENKYRK